MPRVLPTDVVTFIDRAFPDDIRVFLNDNNVGPLATVVDLLERVPEELLTLDSASFAALTAARSQLSSDVSGFRILTKRDKQLNNSYPVSLMAAYDTLTPFGSD
jgi:hypothetical protein